MYNPMSDIDSDSSSSNDQNQYFKELNKKVRKYDRRGTVLDSSSLLSSILEFERKKKQGRESKKVKFMKQSTEL